MDKMFDRLEATMDRYNELDELLSSDEVINNLNEYRKLSKEKSDIEDIVEKYKEYKKIDHDIEDLEVLKHDKDLEMAEMARMELEETLPKKEKVIEEIKKLLAPKDPLDDRNVIVEIRGAAGGDEANIFAGDLFRMYTRYAETNGWKIEMLDVMESAMGGYALVSFRVKGDKVYSKLVDIESARDYFLSQVWINNKWDWPGKNWSMWKTSETDDSNEYADGRWRFLFYDMEFGGVSGESDARTNTVKEDNYKKNGLLGMDTNNPAVLCYAYLMTNEGFRKDYNEKLAALSEGIYKKQTLLDGLSQYEAEYGPLYDQFFARYPDTGSKDDALNGGYASSKCIRDFINKREDNIGKIVTWIEKHV